MQEVTITLDDGGKSQALSISSTSAQSAAITSGFCRIYATVDCFARQGSNPTAVSDGTDTFIPGGVWLRVNCARGNKLAFKTTAASGTVYITSETV